MWIVIRCSDREIDNLGTVDTKKEVLDIIYEDLCKVHKYEGDLIDSIEREESGIIPEQMKAWSNCEGAWYDYKAFWV